MIHRSPKRILLSIPHMGGNEQKYVSDAFSSNWLSTVGPNLSALESEFSAHIGLPSVALASGTAAIHLAARALGIGAGDEVICSTFTFAASCNPILYQHAVPIFMDSDYATWNLDPHLLADFLTRRAEVNRLPKALIVVHLFGQSADMDPIVEVCNSYGVQIIEDAAEALGTTYKGKPAGSFGDLGTFSLNGNKIITSTGGGLLCAREKWRVDKVRFWAAQSRDPGINHLHSEVGFNYGMSNVLAGIARGQLELLEQRVEQRRTVAFRYRDALEEVPGFTLMPQASYGRHTNWLSCFLIDPRRFGVQQSDLLRILHDANIDSRPVWKPMHTQPLYRKFESVRGGVAADLNRRGICLPSSSSLSGEDQGFVIETIRQAHAYAIRSKRVSFAGSPTPTLAGSAPPAIGQRRT